MKKILFDILACPDCNVGVCYDNNTEKFVCEKCKKTFAVSRGIPLLFSSSSDHVENSGVSFYKEKNMPEKAGLVKRAARKLSRFSNVSIGETLHDRLKNEYLFNSPAGSLILNLGSGVDNIIMKDNFINFDIFPHPNTDVSGDGHYLPFLSDTFDIVWMCAVLEHLENPFQAASEVYRVLKPGGLVLAGAPFMFHLHGVPHDYFRFTDNGLRSVFKEFKEIECGSTFTMPTGTLIEMVSQYCGIFTEHKAVNAALRLAVKLLLFPFKYLDLYIRKRSQADMLSGGFVYLGKKK